MSMQSRRRHICVAMIGLAMAPWAPAAFSAPTAEPGYVAVAADRGFQGNEEIRDAFEAFAAGRNAELVFVTDARTKDTLDHALERLFGRGADRALVLPVFISASDPQWVRAKGYLANQSLQLEWARPFGESYLAVEALAERLRAIRDRAKTRLVVAGFGADGPETRKLLERDWQRITDFAAETLGFSRTDAVVWDDGKMPDREAKRAESRRTLAQSAPSGERTVVVPFHFGRRLDGMMAFEADLRRALPAGAELLAPAPSPESWLATWMTREGNRHATLEPREVGVILLAHGSDYHWNETMREAVRPLEARHPVEYVFSMADQRLIERAVRRLERRGARAAVIVRVFGLVSSFREQIERMIGTDIEGGSAARTDSHGEHGHAGSAAAPRIRSTLVMATAGGLEADPLFAAALLDRARALSRDPTRETVILTAHGAGPEDKNEQWLAILDRLCEQIKAGGVPFRDVRYATWREDWPDKRDPWVAKVRSMVAEAERDGGRALVIPARTNGRGPEQRFLEGLTFDLGEGFAPHPLFLRWVEEQVEAGRAVLRQAGLAQTLAKGHEPPRYAGHFRLRGAASGPVHDTLNWEGIELDETRKKHLGIVDCFLSKNEVSTKPGQFQLQYPAPLGLADHDSVRNPVIHLLHGLDFAVGAR